MATCIADTFYNARCPGNPRESLSSEHCGCSERGAGGERTGEYQGAEKRRVKGAEEAGFGPILDGRGMEDHGSTKVSSEAVKSAGVHVREKTRHASSRFGISEILSGNVFKFGQD